jgi:DNA-binding XRE family transcriptional regulator
MQLIFKQNAHTSILCHKNRVEMNIFIASFNSHQVYTIRVRPSEVIALKMVRYVEVPVETIFKLEVESTT